MMNTILFDVLPLVMLIPFALVVLGVVIEVLRRLHL